MKLPEKYPAEATIFYCLRGGKAHKAFYHIDRGIGYYWCPKHGILCSTTGRLVGNEKAYRYYDGYKQMTNRQMEKFRQMFERKIKG